MVVYSTGDVRNNYIVSKKLFLGILDPPGYL